MSAFLTSSSSGNNSSAAAPALPTWTFSKADLSAPDSGCFTTDGTRPGATAAVNFNFTSKFGTASFRSVFEDIFIGTGSFPLQIMLTDSAGRPSVFSVESFSLGPSNDCLALGLASVDEMGDGSNWSGDYQVSFIPVMPPSIADLLPPSGIIPIADGGYNIVGPNSTGSIFFQNGICVGFTDNS